jgi:hypothetical protein
MCPKLTDVVEITQAACAKALEASNEAWRRNS